VDSLRGEVLSEEQEEVRERRAEERAVQRGHVAVLMTSIHLLAARAKHFDGFHLEVVAQPDGEHGVVLAGMVRAGPELEGFVLVELRGRAGRRGGGRPAAAQPTISTIPLEVKMNLA